MVKVSKGGGNLLRGAATLLGMTVKNPATREKIQGLGELAAGALEDGVEISIERGTPNTSPGVIRRKRGEKS